jgi:outer membrane lipoprotein SlyB
MNRHLKLGGIVALAAALAACAQPQQRYGYSGSQPVYSGSQPVYSGNQPTYSSNEPTYSSNQPAYSGNGGNYPAPVYDSSNNNGNYSQQAQSTANVSTWGTVVRIDNLGAPKDTGLGAAIGAGIGAIAGNQIGRSMNDAKTTGTVVGAVGGGVVGNAIERNQNANNATLRVYVRLDSGEERYWDVSAAQLHPSVGQRLRVQDDQL